MLPKQSFESLTTNYLLCFYLQFKNRKAQSEHNFLGVGEVLGRNWDVIYDGTEEE